MSIKTKWFEFRQNNSRGYFDFYAKAGIGHIVWIEGVDVDHACLRAERIGLYFDGVGDCPCCGNRWHKPWDADGKPSPGDEYSGSIERIEDGQPVAQYLGEDHLIFVHPIEGPFWQGIQVKP